MKGNGYKASTLVELLIVMILMGIVMASVYRSLDMVPLLMREMSEAEMSVSRITDSLQYSYKYIQDSIYFAGVESLKTTDIINEIQ